MRRLRAGSIVVLLAGMTAGRGVAQEPKAERGGKYALLVGVRNYAPDTLRNLPYTEADVTALAAVLERSGYRREDISILTQTIGAGDPGLLPLGRNIRTQLGIPDRPGLPFRRGLALGPLGGDDTVVVALAGHGVQFNAEGESFFCPMDADLTDESSLIKLSDVSQALDGCKAGFKLLLVDACRNNPQILVNRAGERPVVDLPSLSRPFLRRPPGGTLAMFSCSPGEVAFEDPEVKHGIFFHHILRGLNGDPGLNGRVADTDGDGRVDTLELAQFAEKNVFQHASRRYRREQTVEIVNRTRRAVAIVEARLAKLLTNSLGMRLVLIPAGEFLMGSSGSEPDAGVDEQPQHRVRITRPFYLGATEVTVGQFRRFVASISYRTEAERDGKGGYGVDEKGQYAQDPKYTWQSPGFAQTDEHPVVNVSWNDAVAFCEWLSRQEGQTYRLPTEAEWEYACRAGMTTRYSSGDDAETLATVGNVADATAREKFPGWTWTIAARDGYVYTAPVGRFRANAWGLYDMHGNVLEWCSDGYDAGYYGQSPAADPPGLLQASGRVFRGGGWSSFPRNVRSANRSGFAPVYRNYGLGFRVARVQSGK